MFGRCFSASSAYPFGTRLPKRQRLSSGAKFECGKMSGEGKIIVTKLVSNYRRDSKRKLDKESMDR